MTRDTCTSTFTQMLLSLLEGSTSLTDALRLLARPGMSVSHRQVASQILETMRKGETFSVALAEMSAEGSSKVRYSPLHLALISAGERTGSLLQILRSIEEDFNRKREVREVFITALIYPAAIILIALVGTLVILFMGLPFLQGTGITTALTIQSITSGIINAGLFLILAAILLFYIIRKYLASESEEYRVFSLLSFLTQANIPLGHALTQCIRGTEKKKSGMALVRIKRDITSGVPLAQAFANTGFFSPFVVGWLTIAEEQNGAGHVFFSLADFYKKKDQRARAIISRMIEPVVIIITGIYLLILVQTTILPILTNVGGFI